MSEHEKCIHKVSPPGQYGSFHQRRCHNKAVKDGYCKIHHPRYIEAKRTARQEIRDTKREHEKALHNKKKLQKEAAKRLLVRAKSALVILNRLQMHGHAQGLDAAIKNYEKTIS